MSSTYTLDMIAAMVADPLPFAPDAYGDVRVAGTRVTMSTILFSYLQGDSAEQIVEGFPTVPLAAVHATIAYYLNHRAELDGYLREVERRQAEARREAQSQPGYAELRDRLRARYAAMQARTADGQP